MATTADKKIPQEEAPKKKGVFQALKEKLDDKEEQFEYISVLVRLVVVAWSGALVTLNYLPEIPGLTSGEKQDITFPASLLASSLASFGLEKSAKKQGDGTYNVNPDDKPLSKKELLSLLGSQNSGYQTIRVEQPIRILGAEVVDSSKKS
tara:strand:- start:2624 stop:3073 length:450 start_codon:yes stop_codon:yes gene_type:complete